MIVLSWVACSPPAADSDRPDRPGDSDAPIDTDTGTPELVAFSEPADAVDLDASPDVLHVSLVADELSYEIGDETVVGFAYDGQVPGPTLRAKLGDTLIVDLENRLDEATTIHWHGLSVPWEMDGVTWMQDPVDPGETYTYTFTLSTAGTFWYHPHFDGSGQVDRGLYGAIVVTDPADPLPDREVLLVVDAGLEDADGAADHGVLPPAGPWTVNGVVRPTLGLPAGSAVRARVVNVSNTGYLDLRWPDPRHVAGDQGVLAALGEPTGGLVLGPGDRADLEWLVGPEPFALSNAPYSLAGGPALGDAEPLLQVAVEGAAGAPSPLPWGFSGQTPTPDPPYTDVTWVFQGDGEQWFVNGEQYPDVTVEELALGEAAVVELRNLSPTEHPFHLHGHAFEVLSVDGVPPAARRIEDTVNVPIRSVVRVRIVGDNPGDWMAHCHILPHAHDGMMTVLRVGPP
jgi:FtsP/CotA-like multicopper oxidase with cupredoxin domain